MVEQLLWQSKPGAESKVQVLKNKCKKFRFGGGNVLPSILNVKFPGKLAGKDVMFLTHMVKGNIPLLWSRPPMSRAGTILDLTCNRAEILGLWVDLNLTAVGHYALDILPKSKEKAEECLVTLPMDPKEKKATLLKPHRQFGHPRLDVMARLLKKVNCDDKEARDIVINIHEHCATCKRFSPTPAGPLVSLPAASKFGAILMKVKIGPYKYFFHMLGGFIPYTISIFLKNKKAKTIINGMLGVWVATFGSLSKGCSDVGREFNNDAMHQMGEAA